MRQVVYTAIFGDYDILHEIPKPQSEIDYICFTDNKKLRSDTWRIELKSTVDDACRTARLIKICPHRFLKEYYDYSMWIDGSMRLNILPNMVLLLNNLSLGASVHPTRNCIYDEAVACKKCKNDNIAIIDKQITFYRDTIGFPKHIGLWETGVLLRKHNDKKLILLSETWWDHVKKYSRRDQLSFPVVFKNYDFVSFPKGLTRQFILTRQHIKKYNERLV